MRVFACGRAAGTRCGAYAATVRFIAECKRAGKKVMVWTVNEPAHMIEVGRPLERARERF